MIRSIAFASLIAFVLTVSTGAYALDSYYTGANVPSEEILLENLKVLLGPSSRGGNRAGPIREILGTHYQNDINMHQVYYCYTSPKSNYVYGSRRGQTGCYQDVIIFRLDSGKWIMRNSVTSEWIIIKEKY